MGVVSGPPARRPDGFVLIPQLPRTRSRLRGKLRSLPGPGQDERIRGPLGGAPGLLRGVPDIALAKALNSRRLQAPGIFEDGPDGFSHYHGLLSSRPGTARLLPFRPPWVA